MIKEAANIIHILNSYVKVLSAIDNYVIHSYLLVLQVLLLISNCATNHLPYFAKYHLPYASPSKTAPALSLQAGR